MELDLPFSPLLLTQLMITIVAFGWLYLIGKLGSITDGFFFVLLASTSFMGIPGWRIAFHVVGFVSVIVGILLCIFANDLHFPKSDSGAKGRVIHKHFWSDVKEVIHEAKSVIRIPSFQIIVAQGVSRSFP